MDSYSLGELGTGTVKPEVVWEVSRLGRATVIFRLNYHVSVLGSNSVGYPSYTLHLKNRI